MEPQRIQLSRRKGFKLPAKTAVVSRPSRWGNPFKVDSIHCDFWRVVSPDGQVRRYGQRDDAVREAIAAHRANLLRGTLGYTIEDVKRELAGKNLACWCKLPEPGHIDLCHAATLLYYANEPSEPTHG